MGDHENVNQESFKGMLRDRGLKVTNQRIYVLEALQASRGSSPIRILINAIPVVIAFFGRKQIALANNRLINMCVNMSMVTVIVYIVASMTSGIMTGRLPGYTMLFNFLLYPYLLNKVFNETV